MIVTCRIRGCGAQADLSDEQVRTVEQCSGRDGDDFCIIPIGPWRFFVFDGMFIGICGRCEPTMPRPHSDQPIIHGARS